MHLLVLGCQRRMTLVDVSRVKTLREIMIVEYLTGSAQQQVSNFTCFFPTRIYISSLVQPMSVIFNSTHPHSSFKRSSGLCGCHTTAHIGCGKPCPSQIQEELELKLEAFERADAAELGRFYFETTERARDFQRRLRDTWCSLFAAFST